jgi:hypothetical protein
VTNAKFDNFIEKEIHSSDSSRIDWASKKKEWIAQLDKFYEIIESFLKPYTNDSRMNIDFSDKEITEELIGSYLAKKATISFGSKTILLDPIGTNLIASKGRVDLIGSYGSVKFVLADDSITKLTTTYGERPSTSNEKINWVWKIATRPPIRFLPLTEESFLEALMEVSNA